MLIPVYLRGLTYYLHIRIAGKQFKRSLHTSDKTKAIIQASKFLEAIGMVDWSKVKKYEVNFSQGIFKADGEEDHQRMMDFVKIYQQSAPSQSAPPPPPAPTGLTLLELLDKYLLLRKPKASSVLAFKNTVDEFEKFIQTKCYLSRILTSDITRYQEHLANKGNAPRTIDNKVAYLKTLLNFAVRQGYLQNQNPVTNKPLQSKKDKAKNGYGIFELQEIVRIYSSAYFKAQQMEDPDYYYVMLLGLVTGCRIGELTSLTKEQFQKSQLGNHFIVIRDSKTTAGLREIPVPKVLFDEGLQEFLDQKTESVFKYKTRSGKGSGNAVGKKFSRQLNELGITRGKLVFHSIRKFVNDNYMKSGLEYEPRCQVMGHGIDAVNVSTYTNKFSIDDLSEMINQIQFSLLLKIKLQK
jgi:integrase